MAKHPNRSKELIIFFSLKMSDANYVPVRCYTCARVLGRLQEAYEKSLAEGKTIEQTLDDLKLSRYCCRMRMMCQGQLPLGAVEDPDQCLVKRNPDPVVSRTLEQGTRPFILMPDPSEPRVMLTPLPTGVRVISTGARRRYSPPPKKKDLSA